MFILSFSPLFQRKKATEARLIMYCCRVCVCVCVCVRLIISCEQNISKSYKRISMKFYEQVGCGPRRKRLDFGVGPDSLMDPGSFSRILYH